MDLTKPIEVQFAERRERNERDAAEEAARQLDWLELDARAAVAATAPRRHLVAQAVVGAMVTVPHDRITSIDVEVRGDVSYGLGRHHVHRYPSGTQPPLEAGEYAIVVEVYRIDPAKEPPPSAEAARYTVMAGGGGGGGGSTIVTASGPPAPSTPLSVRCDRCGAVPGAACDPRRAEAPPYHNARIHRFNATKLLVAAAADPARTDLARTQEQIFDKAHELREVYRHAQLAPDGDDPRAPWPVASFAELAGDERERWLAVARHVLGRAP